MKKTLGALVLLSLTGQLFAEPMAPTEYQIKGAFLYNFAKFVEWPQDVMTKNAGTFTIGILGQDPFGDDLDQLLTGKTIQDKRLILRRVSDVQEAAGCNVLFISASKDTELKSILNSLKGLPILTVSDMNDFIERGGVVGFSVEGNKVRFSVNTKASNRAGLKISSQLLKLAKTIISKRLLNYSTYAWLPSKIILFAKS